MSEDFSKLSEASSGTPRRAQVALLVLLTTVLLFFVAEAVSGLLIGFIPIVRHWPKAYSNDWLVNSVAAQFAYVFITDGLLVAGITAALKLFRWRYRTIGLVKPKVWHIAFGVVSVVPYYALYLMIVFILSIFMPYLNVSQKQDIGFNSVHGTMPLIFTFISLVIIPPLVEEITMRGFLYTGLKKWLPRILAALAVSTLFGAAHLMEGGAAGPLWIGAIDTFTLSLVLVFLREKTGNLWAGITLHALKNGVAFFLLFIIGGR